MSSEFTAADLAMVVNLHGSSALDGALMQEAGLLMQDMLHRRGVTWQSTVGLGPEGYDLAGAIYEAEGRDGGFAKTVARYDADRTINTVSRNLLVAATMPQADVLKRAVHSLRSQAGVTVSGLAVLINDRPGSEAAANQLGLRTHELLRADTGRDLIVPAGGELTAADLYRSLTAETRDPFGQHAQELGAASIVRSEQPFKLKYGGESRVLVGLIDGHTNAGLLKQTGRLILSATAAEEYDVVAGTGIDGGLVVSGVMLAALNRGRNVLGFRASDKREGLSAEDDPKNGWGFRPKWVQGRRVLAVEGTATTGGSLETLVELLREAGGIVVAAAVVVDRSRGALAEVQKRLGIHPDTEEPLKIYTLFTLDEDAGTLVPVRNS